MHPPRPLWLDSERKGMIAPLNGRVRSWHQKGRGGAGCTPSSLLGNSEIRGARNEGMRPVPDVLHRRWWLRANGGEPSRGTSGCSHGEARGVLTSRMTDGRPTNVAACGWTWEVFRSVHLSNRYVCGGLWRCAEPTNIADRGRRAQHGLLSSCFACGGRLRCYGTPRVVAGRLADSSAFKSRAAVEVGWQSVQGGGQPIRGLYSLRHACGALSGCEGVLAGDSSFSLQNACGRRCRCVETFFSSRIACGRGRRWVKVSLQSGGWPMRGLHGSQLARDAL